MFNTNYIIHSWSIFGLTKSVSYRATRYYTEKLEVYGLREVALRIIKIYPSDHYQYASTNDHLSNKVKIRHGVP